MYAKLGDLAPKSVDRRRPAKPIMAAVLVAALSAGQVAFSQPAAASPASPPAGTATALTREQIAELPVDEQNAILDPLRLAARSLDTYGRDAGVKTYGGVGLDPVNGTVDLYLTDVGQEAAFVDHANKDLSFDVSRVRVHQSAYTRAALQKARDKVIAHGKQAGQDVLSVAVPQDGSGLDVGVAAQASGGVQTAAVATAVQLESVSGVNVAVHLASASTNESRFADSWPYYSGGYINGSAGSTCTTGLTVHNSANTYLITAAHCARTGDTIRNGYGNVEGTVLSWNEEWDAALIDARSLQYEFDGQPSDYNPIPVRGAAYSYYNDSVCQDGYTSGVICNTVVMFPDIWLTHCGGPYPCESSRGVVGQQPWDSGTASRGGDSGGLVFCVCNGSGPRQARGIVVSDYYGDAARMFWTEAPDILSAFGMSMYS